MKFKGKRFYLSTIPSFALSVLIMIGTGSLLFSVLVKGCQKLIKIDKNLCGDIAYIFLNCWLLLDVFL